jgi:hypothetical protein
VGRARGARAVVSLVPLIPCHRARPPTSEARLGPPCHTLEWDRPGLQILKDSKLKKLEEMLSDVADAPRKKDAECSLHCRAVVRSDGHARAHSP